jgi:pimeloyl-ACP methyl ester carboxylesterase
MGSAQKDRDRSERLGRLSAVAQRQLAIGSREFTVYDEGDPVGPAILVHHGTPGAGPPYSGWVGDAKARGARLIAYDRPGYGASTATPGRAIGDAALDAASIVDALGVQQFATWGVSGGGPHALACAALLPDRVTAACSIAGVGPFDADGLNYFNGMGHDNLVEFGLAMAGREHIAPFATAAAAEMLENLDDLAASIQTLVAEPDRIALGGPIGSGGPMASGCRSPPEQTDGSMMTLRSSSLSGLRSERSHGRPSSSMGIRTSLSPSVTVSG